MIDFRYHLVSIVAIFLALAAGVTLGAGPLHESLNAQAAAQTEDTADTKAELQEQLSAAKEVQSFEDGFASATGKSALSERLKDKSVAVFQLPGAQDEAVEGLESQIEAAGGSVTARIPLTDKMLDPSERQFAEGIARQALNGQKATPDTSGMASYELLGTGLARAYLTGDSENGFDSTAATIASAYREAGFVGGDGSPDSRASLAVFVTGGSASGAVDGQDELAATIVAAADKASGGAVLAGDPAQARDGGSLAYVRSSEFGDAVSTVDAVDVRAGQIVTVLALAGEADGKSGHFGTGEGADRTMPELG